MVSACPENSQFLQSSDSHADKGRMRRRRPAGQSCRLLFPVVFLLEFAGESGVRGDDAHIRRVESSTIGDRRKRSESSVHELILARQPNPSEGNCPGTHPPRPEAGALLGTP